MEEAGARAFTISPKHIQVSSFAVISFSLSLSSFVPPLRIIIEIIMAAAINTKQITNNNNNDTDDEKTAAVVLCTLQDRVRGCCRPIDAPVRLSGLNLFAAADIIAAQTKPVDRWIGLCYALTFYGFVGASSELTLLSAINTPLFWSFDHLRTWMGLHGVVKAPLGYIHPKCGSCGKSDLDFVTLQWFVLTCFGKDQWKGLQFEFYADKWPLSAKTCYKLEANLVSEN